MARIRSIKPDPDDQFHAPTCPDFCPGPPDEHLRVSASVAENRTVPAVRKHPGTRPPLGSDDEFVDPEDVKQYAEAIARRAGYEQKRQAHNPEMRAVIAECMTQGDT